MLAFNCSIQVMHLRIESPVDTPLASVKMGFTRELFLRLNPPFPPVKLLRFDGCEKGDEVGLELNFILFKQKWISDITDSGEKEGQWFFLDEGRKLPFFLRSWKHQHVVQSVSKSESKIIDDIHFTTGTLLTDLLLFPALYVQFLYRKPIYKKYFKATAT